MGWRHYTGDREQRRLNGRRGGLQASANRRAAAKGAEREIQAGEWLPALPGEVVFKGRFETRWRGVELEVRQAQRRDQVWVSAFGGAPALMTRTQVRDRIGEYLQAS